MEGIRKISAPASQHAQAVIWGQEETRGQGEPLAGNADDLQDEARCDCCCLCAGILPIWDYVWCCPGRISYKGIEFFDLGWFGLGMQ